MAIGYRHTKTYIAASFDHDRDAVEKSTISNGCHTIGNIYVVLRDLV